jgi:hypothetical protein
MARAPGGSGERAQRGGRGAPTAAAALRPLALQRGAPPPPGDAPRGPAGAPRLIERSCRGCCRKLPAAARMRWTRAAAAAAAAAPPADACPPSPPLTQALGWEYAVLIDAGSSGSRVHVYRFYQHKAFPYATIELPAEVHRTAPGLSAYSFDPRTAANSLQPLLKFAKDKVGRGCVEAAGGAWSYGCVAGLWAVPSRLRQLRMLTTRRGALPPPRLPSPASSPGAAGPVGAHAGAPDGDRRPAHAAGRAGGAHSGGVAPSARGQRLPLPRRVGADDIGGAGGPVRMGGHKLCHRRAAGAAEGRRGRGRGSHGRVGDAAAGGRPHGRAGCSRRAGPRRPAPPPPYPRACAGAGAAAAAGGARPPRAPRRPRAREADPAPARCARPRGRQPAGHLRGRRRAADTAQPGGPRGGAGARAAAALQPQLRRLWPAGGAVAARGRARVAGRQVRPLPAAGLPQRGRRAGRRQLGRVPRRGARAAPQGALHLQQLLRRERVHAAGGGSRHRRRQLLLCEPAASEGAGKTGWSAQAARALGRGWKSRGRPSGACRPCRWPCL